MLVEKFENPHHISILVIHSTRMGAYFYLITVEPGLTSYSSQAIA